MKQPTGEATGTYVIELFSVLREEAGTPTLAIDAQVPIGARQLVDEVVKTNAVIAKYASIITVACNTAFVDSSFEVHPRDEIAFITPVSGG